MASTSETGHAKNVANLEDLIVFCTNYGALYNPVKDSMKLGELNSLLVSANSSLQTVRASKSVYDNSTNVREVAFKPLKKLATKIVNAMAVSHALKQNVDDVKSINLKIQGRRATAIKKTVATAKTSIVEEGAIETIEIVKTASVSQQSFNNIIDHFEHLVHTLTIESNYAPNEDELKISTLNTLLGELRSKNSDVINATANLSNARIARDKALYGEGTGLCDIALDVKNYIKSVFGATSPQYKQVSGLSFKKGAGD
jgi:hypothetical protein